MILPDEAIEVGRSLLENESRVTFRIGDFINDLAVELRASATEVSRVLAYELGSSEHTLRDYAYVASKVCEEHRDKYQLSRHQWKACLGAGDGYLAVAEWAIGYADTNGGRPASVRAIWAHVMGMSEEDYEAENYLVRYVTRLKSLMHDGSRDMKLPETYRTRLREWLVELDVVGEFVDQV